MSNYSVNNINIDNLYTGELIQATVSGAYSLDLSQSNLYKLNLSADTTLTYGTASNTAYNIIVEGGAFSLTLGTGFQTVGATTIGATGSMIISGIYDGSDLWVASSENYQAT